MAAHPTPRTPPPRPCPLPPPAAPLPATSRQAIAKINPSVGEKDILRHENWLKEYGSV